MGCGGSRTDALEPRYWESWTKETESTWLTSAEADIPLSSIQSISSENSCQSGFLPEKGSLSAVADFFDEGLTLPGQAYLKVCSAISDPLLSERNPSNLGSVQGRPQPCSPGTMLQKKSLRHREEMKWQNSRMSTKQVTITMTQSIRHIDQGGKITKTSHTTLELLKSPVTDSGDK
ncbi:brain and acute leukemia cytoplasmic protein-like isoform X5 [Heptranchias perlo]|uniref:brain and acute leukemia cytoplasmic protein-like isoform X5 n=1 Tax=Heptranchias perlo TaxID=212740 RepID=UPI00355AB32C